MYEGKEVIMLLSLYIISSPMDCFTLEELLGERSSKIRSLVAEQQSNSSTAYRGVTGWRLPKGCRTGGIWKKTDVIQRCTIMLTENITIKGK